jgi:hypothetical protein
MSIVSDDPNSFTQSPAGGFRRVPMRVALPVILGCAVIGSIAGVMHPLHSNSSNAQRGKDVVDLTLASVKLIESAPAAGPQGPSTDPPAQAESIAASVLSQSRSTAPSAVASVSTGSVERSLAPGASDNATLTAPNQPEVMRSDSPNRLTRHSHRMARAKRLRRVLWRRARSTPPGSEVDVFFSSLLKK